MDNELQKRAPIAAKAILNYAKNNTATQHIANMIPSILILFSCSLNTPTPIKVATVITPTFIPVKTMLGDSDNT